MSKLEKELEAELLELYRVWKTFNYRATYFKRMLTEGDPIHKGPVGTVKHLLGKNLSEKSGFIRLLNARRIDLTVEALVRQSKWHSLFEEWEIARAIERVSSAHR